jgi:hypothetical protein
VGSLLCTSNLLYAYISIQVHFTTCRIVRLNERRRVSMRVAALSILTAHALCRACDPSKLSKTARCHGRHNGSRLLE